MSRELQAQIDVGSLSIRGLGAFTSILATLSADNVVPMALIQLENLGTVFHVSGECSERVKGLLQRCSDVRLNGLALFIGWRKNDTASLMAESAGGQAIALLSMCLMNLFDSPRTGIILARLCDKLTPRSTNSSSVSQLADVAELLANKVNAIGFGNLLAKETMRVCDAYDALGLSPPKLLLEKLSTELVVDLLEKISQALHGENKICRISGSHGMGHVLGLLQALFLHDTVLTVEGVIVQDVEQSRIRCEVISADPSEPIRVYLETWVSYTMPVNLPVVKPTVPIGNSLLECTYSFCWSKWLVTYLRLIFLNYGLRFDGKMLQAYCDLLVVLPSAFKINPKSRADYKISNNITMLDLLGLLPRARICKICEDILDCIPTENDMDLQAAFTNFLANLEHLFDDMRCSCGSKCNLRKAFLCEYRSNSACPRLKFMGAIGGVLDLGLWSLYVEAGPNTIVRPDPGLTMNFRISLLLQRKLALEEMEPQHFLESIFRLTTNCKGIEDSLITSSGSCTAFPKVLTDMKMPSHQNVSFSFVDGQIIHEQRCYNRVNTAKPRGRPRAKKSLTEKISPSHIGIHTGNPLITIRETYRSLELQCSVQYARSEIKVDLKDVIKGYVGMRWTRMCSHPTTDQVDLSKFEQPPIATSIASPAAFRRLGVTMTRGHPVAQFLCCEYGHEVILQKECCLNCATEGLDPSTNAVIIIG